MTQQNDNKLNSQVAGIQKVNDIKVEIAFLESIVEKNLEFSMKTEIGTIHTTPKSQILLKKQILNWWQDVANGTTELPASMIKEA